MPDIYPDLFAMVCLSHDELDAEVRRLRVRVSALRSALESVAWGYTGGADAKTLGEIAGKALTEDEKEQ